MKLAVFALSILLSCTALAAEGASAGPRPAGVEGVSDPKLLRESRTSPVYPELARVARMEGRVTLQAIVRKDGSVDSVEVLDSNTPKLGFEEAAIKAVRQWRYEPARLEGEPVDVYFTVIVDFELNKPAVADVVSVEVDVSSGKAAFSVGIRSPDEGCEQYASWWEVVTEDGRLLVRRVLSHSHVEEQPFVRTGEAIDLEPGKTVWVRAHMHPYGYGGQAMSGSIRDGFEVAKPPPGFAAKLGTARPRPPKCRF